MPAFTITREDESTYEIEVPTRLITRYKKLCTQMASLLTEIQEQHAPEANLYLEGEGTPYLMGGVTHGGNKFSPRAFHENVITTGVWWPRSGGGGW